MTKVNINPGVCGLNTVVEAELIPAEKGLSKDVRIKITSGCEAVKEMFKQMGDTYDAYKICLCRPGANAFYKYASENFPPHGSCPVIAGITKCIEAECRLALKAKAEIDFE